MFGGCGNREKDGCSSKAGGSGGGGQKKNSSKAARQPDSSDQEQFSELISNTYRIGRKIGSGSYGQIRVGINVQTNQTVAIKFEKMGHDAQLQNEYFVYGLLRRKKGFPDLFYFGRYKDYQVLVMEMLGRDLESCYEKCGRRFSLKSMIFITLQLLKRFETLHEAGILYRDVKPENFMLGITTNTVYIIDFGLSKQFTDAKGEHIPFGPTHELIGTSRYMSRNAHLCNEQSRRDDLEALGYVFAYFLRGKLPWSGLMAENFKQHNMMIYERKRNCVPEELLDGHPVEYAHYLNYVRQLEYKAKPNYAKLRNMFKRFFFLNKLVDDGVYDWNS